MKSYRTEFHFLAPPEREAESSVLLPRKLHLTGPLLVALLLWGHLSSSQILCFVSHLLHIIPWAVLSDSWCDCSTVQINDLIIPSLLCLALPSLTHFIRLAGAEIPKLTLPESTNLWAIISLGRGTKKKFLELPAHSLTGAAGQATHPTANSKTQPYTLKLDDLWDLQGKKILLKNKQLNMLIPHSQSTCSKHAKMSSDGANSLWQAFAKRDWKFRLPTFLEMGWWYKPRSFSSTR